MLYSNVRDTLPSLYTIQYNSDHTICDALYEYTT